MSQSITNLSAKELFELARRREAEERERQQIENKRAIQSLKSKRKALVKQNAKALKHLKKQQGMALREIDQKIAALSHSTRGLRAAGGANQPSTQKVMDYLSTVPEASSKELKAALEESDSSVPHLAQTLAYLVRQGRVKRVRRGIYRRTP